MHIHIQIQRDRATNRDIYTNIQTQIHLYTQNQKTTHTQTKKYIYTQTQTKHTSKYADTLS